MAFTHVADLVEVAPHESFARKYACKEVKKMMEVYIGCIFYIAVANFSKVGVNLAKHQNIEKVGKVSQ